MKVVIANGFHEADYIISLFNTRHNDLIVLNDDEYVCQYLSLKNDIPVMRGKATRKTDLKEAGAENCDLFIALSEDDYKNYVACKTAKLLMNAKRCIATVINPKNVEIFRELGIDTAVSSAYLLGERIKSLTSVENMVNSLSMENEHIFIDEIRISSDLEVAGKTLAEINISDLGSVASIVRNEKALIPNGQMRIESGDKVLIVTTAENRNKAISIFQRKKK
ncbi:MAG: TrkA family potassium uptake protein [Erysipelotrichaceae bacterium]|jgi:trk system potassium uptake protein TrkA|nr:TrkA family potassium uptake protein [Erysipelotrichaceae bacterium]